MLRVITSKFAGNCASCGKPLNKGDRVRWNGNGKVYCLAPHSHDAPETGATSHVILISPHNQIQVYRVGQETMSAVFDLLPDQNMSVNLDAPTAIQEATPNPEVTPAPLPEIDVQEITPESIQIDPMAALFKQLQE